MGPQAWEVSFEPVSQDGDARHVAALERRVVNAEGVRPRLNVSRASVEFGTRIVIRSNQIKVSVRAFACVCARVFVHGCLVRASRRAPSALAPARPPSALALHATLCARNLHHPLHLRCTPPSALAIFTTLCACNARHPLRLHSTPPSALALHATLCT